MAVVDKLLPVTIPTWPTCNDCLSWSEDDLAVAGGEIVYILTPKNSASSAGITGHPQWHVLNLRINLFDESEWPELELATIQDLSIGEEQSSSHAVAVAWSPSGIGMHRRSVLGVLTSNLILSLWETDGSRSSYHRTCIVNKSLIDQSLPDYDRISRRRQRIRSFAWLPALKPIPSSRWGSHYLIIADDDENIILLRVIKTNNFKLGDWSISVELRINRSSLDTTDLDSSHMSPLQKKLHQQAPITKITTTPWVGLKIAEDTCIRGGLDSISSTKDLCLSACTFTSCISTYTANICASISEDGKPLDLINFRDLQECGVSFADFEIDGSSARPTALNMKEPQPPNSLPESYFVEAIRPLSEEFDRSFRLSGYVRTRFWGSAVSADGKKMAACITLHPSDMIEYSIPSVEKCTVVFRNAKTGGGNINSIPKPPSAVRIQVLQFVLEQMTNEVEVSSLLDAKLLSMYSRVISSLSSIPATLKESFEQVRSQKYPNDEYHNNQFETCEICNDKINSRPDIMEATCDSGHQFSRCHLTFLAIQEPGISKYCSKCGKEFLDLVKLDPVRAASTGLAQTIFDEFDVCPYCQGKFRG